MAPRKSNESDKEKTDYTSENEADVSNEEGSDNEPIKKTGKSNGKEASAETNGKDEEAAGSDEEGNQSDEEGGQSDEDANGKAEDDDDDDEAPIKKRKVAGKGRGRPAGKKKAPAAKATNKKKKAAAPVKKPVEEEENGGEEEYEVKEIIDSKKEKNTTLYLIRWKGYTAADDTWEKASDLSCDDLIAAFNKKKSEKKTPAAKQPPKKRKKEEDEDPEKEYEVERIISMLENKKGKVFRIRWKGFRSTQDTWEPEENLNCKDLIEKFLKKYNEQSQYSSKSLREDPKRTKRLVNETKNPRARASKRSSAKARKTYYSEDDDSE